MRHFPRLPASPALLTALAALASLPAPAARADIAGEPSRLHALTGVTLIAEPGAAPVTGTIVLRDGRIESLGTGAEIPAGAVVHDRPGRVVYAGFVEPYLRLEPAPDEIPKPGTEMEPEGVSHANHRVHADRRVADGLPLPEELRTAMREAGYTTAFVAAGDGVFRGLGAVVSLGDGDPAAQVLAADHAQVLALETGNWRDPRYPNSLMGAIALSRQTLYDAAWHRDAWAAWNRAPEGMERPAENAALRALVPVVDRILPVWMESENVDMLPRVLAIAREFGFRPVVVSGGSDDWRRAGQVADWMKAARAELILAVDFPRAPDWGDPEEQVGVELDRLIAWERAPTNPAALDAADLRFAVTTQGLDEREYVLARLRTAVRFGLPPERALAAVTTEPARLLGLSGQVGTLAPEYAANLVVMTGPLFDRDSRIEEVWIDGVRYGDDPVRAEESDVRGRWRLTVGAGADREEVTVKLDRVLEGMEGSVAGDPDEEGSTTDSAPGAAALEGVVLRRGELTFALDGAGYSLRRRGRMLEGTARRDGVTRPVLGRRVYSVPDEPSDLDTVYSASAAPWPPVADPAAAPRSVVVRNATVWTCGEAGILEGADLLVTDGKIAAVGRNLGAPGGAFVIDGAGKHVTPGLIDCHSHSSISGGVNECTNSCTAEVRVRDVVNPRSPHIYRELAGGLTVSNLLHGSCNAIGGQNAVIKLKWGRPAEELLLAGAPEGIKFALGENVKRSNWDSPWRVRYPATRMGVEQFIRERFDAALRYRHDWDAWKADGRRGAPPRRDLQLDALLEILDGDRLVHCHSYRADEIIMMIRVADDYGFRIGTFQHVLEGYKAADEIARHGAGASSFSDRWAYKYEVIDAIPYNGELMTERGVNVSYNSDSSELSRRMNLEAAKAVKWGGVPETEALNYVTRNPAVQLGIDEWVGSLEPGKHGDFVVWSAHPLADAAVCEQTWIEGVRRFSRDGDRAAGAAAQELRETLLRKAVTLRRMQELDTTVTDKGSWPGTTLGRRFGESEEEAGLEVVRGLCRIGSPHAGGP